MQSLTQSLLFTAISMLPVTAFADCPESPDMLTVSYNQRLTQNGNTRSQTIEIWRQSRRVAIKQGDSGYIELWELGAKNEPKLTRYLEPLKQGIEYYSHSPNPTSESVWLHKWQLVSQTELDALLLIDTKTNACNTVQSLRGESIEKEVALDWLSFWRLPKHLTRRSNNTVLELRLNTLSSNADEVDAFFDQLDLWKTTDFADIGDSESDPVLAKMINMGFIEH